MTSESFNIDDFAFQVRSLIRKCNALKEENTNLKDLIVSKEEEIQRLKDENSQQETRYNNLMAARMLNIADGSIDDTKKKVNDLIRTVNQCITLINDNNQ